MVKVRYTGVVPTLFAGRVGYHEPGDVFGLSDEEAEGYIHRPDIEVVEEPEPEPEQRSEPQDGAAETAEEPVAVAKPVADPAPQPTTETAAEPAPETPAQ